MSNASSLVWSGVYATFPLMRFKPRLTAVLRIFLSAEGRGRLAFWLRSTWFLRGIFAVSAVVGCHMKVCDYWQRTARTRKRERFSYWSDKLLPSLHSSSPTLPLSFPFPHLPFPSPSHPRPLEVDPYFLSFLPIPFSLLLSSSFFYILAPPYLLQVGPLKSSYSVGGPGSVVSTPSDVWAEPKPKSNLYILASKYAI